MGCMQSMFSVDQDLEEDYELTKELGRGVEGTVWLARKKETGEQVAVKLVKRGEDLGLGPEKVRREIQLQAKLSHPNIVELRQVILTRKHLGIVMTYEEGGDLHHYCQKFKLDEDTARFFFRQIVAALEYCHQHNVAHRDLKLANFLLNTHKPPTVKLTDFGCARKWDRKAPPGKVARMKTYAGTPAYMSPQVIESAFYPTHTYSAVEADVWALGILLCHMLFGKHTPYWLEPNSLRGEAATMHARISAMKDTNWADTDPYLRQKADALSPELRDLLDKIFVGDEQKRLTIQGIKEHPWWNGPLHPALAGALEEQQQEQTVRRALRRATVSTAAGRYEGQNLTGDFETIDLLVEMAQKHRTMPPGVDHMFVLDMAHMAEGPVTISSTEEEDGGDLSIHMGLHGVEGSRHGGASRHSSRMAAVNSTHGSSSRHSGSRHCVASPGAAGGKSVSLYASLGGGEVPGELPAGTQPARGGGETSTNGTAAPLETAAEELTVEVVPTTVGGSVGFKKTLSLHTTRTGMVLASYQLEPSVHGGTAHGSQETSECRGAHASM